MNRTPRAQTPGPRRRASVPRGRAATVARLIQSLTARNGQPPTDAELAAMLATSEAHVRRARRRLRQ
jgi:hypothetical protein